MTSAAHGRSTETRFLVYRTASGRPRHYCVHPLFTSLCDVKLLLAITSKPHISPQLLPSTPHPSSSPSILLHPPSFSSRSFSSRHYHATTLPNMSSPHPDEDAEQLSPKGWGKVSIDDEGWVGRFTDLEVEVVSSPCVPNHLFATAIF